MSTLAAEILLVEDNAGDAKLAQEALNDVNFHHNLHIAVDGVEAMDFLYKREKFKDITVTPDLIILDLNLPRKDGREVLAEIKNNLDFKKIPVVVLTSSSAEKDITESFKHHANRYIKKPLSFEAFVEAMERIKYFYSSYSKMPEDDYLRQEEAMKQKLLIIDDNKGDIDLIKEMLTNLDIFFGDIITAQTGEDGVKKAAEYKPTIALIDTRLPGMNGFHTCKEIRKLLGSNVKIIVMTGVFDSVDAIQARKAGADEYGVKTANCESILRCIKSFLT